MMRPRRSCSCWFISSSTWMVKRRENGDLGGLWLEGHDLSMGSDLLGQSSRGRRAAPRLQMQPDELPVASHGLTKTATLSILLHVRREPLVRRADQVLDLDDRVLRALVLAVEELGGGLLGRGVLLGLGLQSTVRGRRERGCMQGVVTAAGRRQG